MIEHEKLHPQEMDALREMMDGRVEAILNAMAIICQEKKMDAVSNLYMNIAQYWEVRKNVIEEAIFFLTPKAK